ncbi:hypothetical protein [Brevundimonas diminuta]|jgi:hypothetical protein|uniref:Uncharacterized protein n=1 Tax=Brevundimonas diminuta TaxID=293 RepID=A0A2X1B1F1_BREDI|nr:hypothetical protein [Brevundimonas diminuta]SPU46612.1 Uncharacterised protein [Brevundimonas diminuta]
MNFIKRIFGSVQPRYLIRAYVLSAAFMAFMTWMMLSLGGAKPLHDRAATLAVFGVGALLFPFSKLVWDEIKRVMMGETVFFMNTIILMFLKVLVNFFLWGFSIFIAPLGILYLWFRSRNAAA